MPADGVEVIQSYLTENVHKAILQKPIPAHVRQLILDISNNKR